MVSGGVLFNFDGIALEDASIYGLIVQALQYCCIIQLELTFLVSKLCQFMSVPTDQHWQAINWVLRYLKGTIHHCLFFHKSGSLDLVSYFDTVYGGYPDDRHNVGAYCVFLEDNLVSWQSTKQRVISWAYVESEYRGLASVAFEFI